MIENLPNRPLKGSELESIKEAGEYQLVRPGTMMFGEMSPFDEDSTDTVVIVADSWCRALDRRNGDGWEIAFSTEREEGEDPELLYMVALEALGLA